MKKLLLLVFMLVSTSSIFAQSMVVNRYFNSATGDGSLDVVELVVVEDRLNAKNWIIKDHGNGTAVPASRLDEGGAKFRFNDIPLWADLRSGTVIVIRMFTDAQLLTYTPDTDASDFVIDVSINDPVYFTSLSPTTVKFNVTPHEAVMIRADVTELIPSMTLAERNVILNGANHAVHALGYGDFSTTALNSWNNIKSPKAIFSNGPYTTTTNPNNNYVGNGAIGTVGLTNPNRPNYTTPLTKATPLLTLPNYWNQESSATASMPYGIELYRSTTDYAYNNGPVRKMNAYALVVDPKYVDFKPTVSGTVKTPTNFVADETGSVLACINAGFFGGGAAYSMFRYEGANYANNIASVSRPYNGNNTTYYPTRAAFGLAPNLVPDVTWVYANGSVVSSYTMPSPNALNSAPQPQPTGVGGTIWNNVTAVGGSPMLLRDGAVNITDTEELIVIDNASARARTAIGFTATGKIIMLAVEGNNAGVSDGLNLIELANYMKEMGCVGAINLDGGGSTTLRIGGQAMFTPSDGVERAMPGVILIKAKN